jgi:HAE1 family hydrophobic/amphiphilic exporter-1
LTRPNLTTSFSPTATARRSGYGTSVRRSRQPVDRNVAAYQNNNRGIILAVFKQPGANVIDTVDQIKAQLPQLTARIPPAVKVETILDRTTTIPRLVHDVQFTLGLTIGLVVLVVLLFLRSFWATAIPTITVPLALLGSFAAMYIFSFSLDNLSLMALTIAVGFVVDDAIVVVENIYRHIEEGAPPFEAALAGSREIGFTVLSISLSLVAVFIPLLLMGGIIGRMFREFALTVTASIAVSALVSLTLAPMLCSRFMHRESENHGRVYRIIEAGFNGLLAFYKYTLDIVLRHRAITLGVFFATMALTGVMVYQIPKGFFPIQDTGVIQGFAETAQDAPPDQMMRILREFGAVLLKDPDVAGFGSFTGSTGGANTSNTGRFFIVLKRGTSASSRPRRSSTGCGPSLPRCRARRCSCSRRRTSPWAAASRARASSTRCRIPTSLSSTSGRRNCSKRCARCRSSRTSRPTCWPTLRSSRSPSTATRRPASASRRR